MADGLIPPVGDLSCRHRITIYDALVVAVSVHGDAPLVTAGKRFAASAGTFRPVVLTE